MNERQEKTSDISRQADCARYYCVADERGDWNLGHELVRLDPTGQTDLY